MGPVNNAWVYCSQLTCQQLQAKPKKEKNVEHKMQMPN